MRLATTTARAVIATICALAELWLAALAFKHHAWLSGAFWTLAAVALVIVTVPSSRRSATPAVPPENVRITLRDGRVIPVDCRYTGVEDGWHSWTIVNPPPGHLVEEVTVDAMPPRTVVHLAGDW